MASSSGDPTPSPSHTFDFPLPITEDDGTHVVIRPVTTDRDPDEYNPRHPEPLASAAHDGFATAYTTPTLRQPKAMHPESGGVGAGSGDGGDHTIDFSMSGIVHLPPLPSRTASERGSSISGNVSGGSLASSRKPGGTTYNSAASGSGSDSREVARRGPRQVQRAPAGTSGSESQGDSAGDIVEVEERSVANSTQSELVTFRFEHVVDENGFHVLTGREGALTRCEDEVNKNFISYCPLSIKREC